MSLSINDFSKYTNDIQVHKVKKSNLPSKVTGKHMYFIDNEDGTYSVGVSASDGTIKVCSDNTDKLQEQINVLNEKFEVVQCTLLNGWTGEVWCYKSGRMIHFYGRISNGAQENGTIMFEAPFNLALEYFPVFQTTTNPVGWLYSISNQVCVHSLSTNNDLCINITIGGN